MENRQIDPLQIIGMVLIFGIFTWMMYNQPVPDLETTDTAITAAAEQQDLVQPIASETAKQANPVLAAASVVADTLKLQNEVLSIGISTKRRPDDTGCPKRFGQLPRRAFVLDRQR